MQLSRILLFVSLPACVSAFVVVSSSQTVRSETTRLFDGDGTGGWGIGGQRELTPEEFARSDRAYFDGYKMNTAGDFLRSIQDDKQSFKQLEMDELLGVAKIAGINMKDPSSRMNKFDDEFLVDDDDDELDLSV
jgi:hypothetical protein